MLVERVHGDSAERPTVLGDANGEPAVQVYATGLYEGVRKGDVRWVTGSKVAAGLKAGVLMRADAATPDVAADIDRTSEVERTSSRDHMPPPEGSNFVKRETDVPTATDADVALAAMSKADLMKIARELEVPGRTGMDKSELYEHLRHIPNISSHLP